MINWKPIAVAAVAALLSGCSTAVDCDVVSFHTMNAPRGETVRIEPQDASLAESPEFQFYAAQIKDKVGRIGYRASDDPASEIIFAIKYGVDRSVDETIRYPQCSMRYHFRHGEYGDPYTYGLHCPDAEVELRATFSHFLEVKVHSAHLGEAMPGAYLYKGMVHASSADDNLADMMPYLVAALFDDFPGRSGEVRSVTIERDPDQE